MAGLVAGDHLVVKRLVGAYTHHGIYVGRGRVIHYAMDLAHLNEPCIRVANLRDFSKGGRVTVRPYQNRAARAEVVRRAFSRVGEARYNLLYNNCEHFATWCHTGSESSRQVNGAKEAGAAGVGGVATAAAALGPSAVVSAGVGAIGAAASGLAGGVLAVGLAPTAAATVAVRKALSDDEQLSEDERKARHVGRQASTAAATAGAIGTAATVSAAGAVTGLTGGGLVAGLAAVGGAVGGGVLAGAALAVAAPAVLATGAGVGAYKLAKELTKPKKR